jgi:mannose-6-phosphate isomerase-like protein (cupin superfamily)
MATALMESSMNKLSLYTVLVLLPATAMADDSYLTATVITDQVLQETADNAPNDRVSDQPVVHVESAEGRLGIGVVHRPAIEPGGPIGGIQHHKQSEVYRIMAGRGILVTAKSMQDAEAFDPDGYIVKNLVGPSDTGVITAADNHQPVGPGDIVIIPAGVAHGFSEISEAITYMVVRVDPERLVELK